MPINAAKHIWYNGKLVPWEKATVHVLAHADGRRADYTMAADGPFDAIAKAIDAATGAHAQIAKFEIHSVSGGEDAQGEAVLTVEHNGRSYRGVGFSTNILEAAAFAYLEVINRIESIRPTERSAERAQVDRSVIAAI